MIRFPFVRMFRVKIERKKFEVHVVVHESRAAMFKEQNDRVRCVAFTQCFGGGGIVATVHYNAEDVHRGTIAHESVHVASGIVSRLGHRRMQMRFTCGKASKAEEVFATLVGQITQATHQVMRMGKFTYTKS